MALRWYEFISENHGSITTKGRSEAEAREEAADRKCCREDDLVCVTITPYHRDGIPAPPHAVERN